jgi:anthranilate synthase/aminodeoxychorismate synthase-like glutamine amidotransferase
MILVIDNYDSFTYNLVQFIGELGAEPVVFRNDAVTPQEIEAKNPRGIIISPGPGTPQDAGVSIPAVRELSGKIPLLGVCLGHQAMGSAFGGGIGRTTPLHGKASLVRHDGSPLFEGMENPFSAGRYHSLIVKSEDFPQILEISARTEDGIVMGLRHREHPTFGVQFHPESILTPGGKALLRNFLRVCNEIPETTGVPE